MVLLPLHTEFIHQETPLKDLPPSRSEGANSDRAISGPFLAKEGNGNLRDVLPRLWHWGQCRGLGGGMGAQGGVLSPCVFRFQVFLRELLLPGMYCLPGSFCEVLSANEDSCLQAKTVFNVFEENVSKEFKNKSRRPAIAAWNWKAEIHGSAGLQAPSLYFEVFRIRLWDWHLMLTCFARGCSVSINLWNFRCSAAVWFLRRIKIKTSGGLAWITDE